MKVVVIRSGREKIDGDLVKQGHEGLSTKGDPPEVLADGVLGSVLSLCRCRL